MVLRLFVHAGLRTLLLVLAGPLALAAAPTVPAAPAAARPVRIMAVGDSITAGADFFTCYRYPLWEKLFAAGYLVEFVGTQTSETRVGPLAHEGYGGKNTEFLAETAPAHFRAHPADIVLLHSGHNHSVEEHPVPSIVAATEKLIAAFQAANPDVVVLLAQPIPAGKLPKYSYLPELRVALAALAGRLDPTGKRVVLVDQVSGFNWETDTVSDHVHPNAQGAEKMAAAWFATLQRVLPPPAQTFAPRQLVYKTVAGTPLALHVFTPPPTGAPAPKQGRPAIVFFFGGGWTHGTPIQFYPECAYFADRGYVAISADYRIAFTHHSTPFDSVADARSALRWVRAHATELGIDPTRIVAAGGSAGGHVAVTVALTPDLPEPGEDSQVSPRPDALVLLYPVLDLSPGGFGHDLVGDRFRELSPLALLEQKRPLPPTLIIAGAADRSAPETTARAFQTAASAAGARCELIVVPNGTHPLYSYRAGGGPLRAFVLENAERFLAGPK